MDINYLINNPKIHIKLNQNNYSLIENSNIINKTNSSNGFINSNHTDNEFKLYNNNIYSDNDSCIYKIENNNNDNNMISNNNNKTYKNILNNESYFTSFVSRPRGRPRVIRLNFNCYQCSTNKTCQWRKITLSNNRKVYVCNACGLKNRSDTIKNK